MSHKKTLSDVEMRLARSLSSSSDLKWRCEGSIGVLQLIHGRSQKREKRNKMGRLQGGIRGRSVNVYLPDNLLERLDAIAAQLGENRSRVVAMALESVEVQRRPVMTTVVVSGLRLPADVDAKRQ